MAASFNESQKLDYLWKKIGYGVAKTSIPPPGSGSKEAFNESIASPLLYRGDLVWAQSGSIPSVPPASTSAIVQVYKDGVGGYSPTVECTEDLTAPDNQTWKTNLTDWIPTQFGDNYLVQVYVANTGVSDPQTVGTRLFQAGSGSDDTWFFDYQAGVLNFNGTVIPAAITGGVAGKSVYIVGYRYVGEFGVGSSSNIGNLTVANTTISTTLANGNITLTATGNGLVTITGTGGITIQSGNTDQRPAIPATGTVRFNTLTQNLEIYTGNTWIAAGGGGGNTFSITNQTISPDGSSLVYTLDQSATSPGVLLTINGVNQTPDIDYSVVGNVLTMSSPPEVNDLIQVRFLAGLTTVSAITNSVGNAVISVAYSGNIDLQPSAGHVVNVTGNIIATGNVAAANFNSTSADLAEKYTSDQIYPSGTVLVFGGTSQVTACVNSEDHRAAGVVSTLPAYLMNTELPAVTVAVALAGQVPCCVVGPVAKGDVLTTSTVVGHAKTLDFALFRPGCVIGKALEDCGPGLHTVLIFVSHG
jgi:hypothetical protein